MQLKRMFYIIVSPGIVQVNYGYEEILIKKRKKFRIKKAMGVS